MTKKPASSSDAGFYLIRIIYLTYKSEDINNYFWVDATAAAMAAPSPEPSFTKRMPMF